MPNAGLRAVEMVVNITFVGYRANPAYDSILNPQF